MNNGEIDQIDQNDQLIQMNQIDPKDKMDPKEKMDHIDQMDQIGEMYQTDISVIKLRPQTPKLKLENRKFVCENVDKMDK